MADDPLAEIRASFFIECEELLENLHDGLQQMEDGADDPETINVVFRAVHSIKGGAGAFGLEALVRFAHRYETVLDEVRAGKLEVGSKAQRVFFQAADHLSDLVRICRDGAELPDEETATLLSTLDEFLGTPPGDGDTEEEIDFQPATLDLDFDFDDADDNTSEPSGSADSQQYTILFAPNSELFETGNEPALLLRNLQELGEMEVTCDASELPDLEKLVPELTHLVWHIRLTTAVDEAEIASIFEFVEGLCRLEITREERPVEINLPEITLPSDDVGGTETEPSKDEPPAPPKPENPPAKPAAKTSTPPQAAKSIVRVDLDRIERLVNLVGELVINQAMLSQSLSRSGLSPHSDAMSGLEEFQRLTRDIQDSVMMIRAQPVKSLFQRMSRIVREASAAVEKDVRLQTVGEATEVDKTVIERLADPLTHMVRNAVDHGLESAEDRAAAGKPTQGRVTLSAAHKSGRVVIEIADDGGGINRTRVREIAVNKGLIPDDATLSDAEIDNLLFLPGFSTASSVSDLSGRGVGMDVVRTEIQSLGGRIAISSEPGVGTTFSISLPLTLAVLDGMVIELAGETLVLPLNLVTETLALGNDDVQMVRPGHHVIGVRSGFVPLFDLAAALGYRPALTSFAGTVALLITQEDQSAAALVIDNIIDQRQVVIKGLDESFHRAPGIAAATILGDGQIALILDPSDIIHQASAARAASLPVAQESISA